MFHLLHTDSQQQELGNHSLPNQFQTEINLDWSEISQLWQTSMTENTRLHSTVAQFRCCIGHIRAYMFVCHF